MIIELLRFAKTLKKAIIRKYCWVFVADILEAKYNIEKKQCTKAKRIQQLMKRKRRNHDTMYRYNVETCSNKQYKHVAKNDMIIVVLTVTNWYGGTSSSLI
eukprot:1075259_1